MKVKELFADRSRWIKGHWRQTNVFTNKCNYCLAGAISACYLNKEDYLDVLDRVWIYIRKLDPKAISIEEFNDRKETAYEDIMKLSCELEI